MVTGEAGRESAVRLRLPDFLVLGAPKAGTTSLARWLAEHPDVFVPPEKELGFFDRDWRWSRGVEWYADYFAAAAPAVKLGEATPSYLYWPSAAERIATVVPHARLVVSLRHPVDRAYSHYWYMRGLGQEHRSFEEVCAGPLRGEPEGERPYLAFGYYQEQLDRYERLFPPGAILVLRFEDLSRHPAETFERVCRFIDVAAVTAPNVGRVYNSHPRLRSPRLLRFMKRRQVWRRAPQVAQVLERLNTAERPYPPLDPALRRRLLEHFAPHNDRLAAHLGEDLSGWSQ